MQYIVKQGQTVYRRELIDKSEKRQIDNQNLRKQLNYIQISIHKKRG